MEDYLDGNELLDSVNPNIWDSTSVSPTHEFDTAKKIYRDNMGNIYKCAIIQSQKNSLEFIKEQIKHEASGQLSDTLEWQIESRVNRLELSAGKIWCVLTDKKTIQNKLNILKETTHEICRYQNYLEYMKDYFSDIQLQALRYNNTSADRSDIQNIVDQTIWIRDLPFAIADIKQEIAIESAHSYKVFPLVYHAYSEYENNFPIHFLLETIRGDFLVVRNRFYWTLMPLAQLGYKVINAMSF